MCITLDLLYLVGWYSIPLSKLPAEVRIIQGIKTFYGDGAVDLIESYSTLANEGKKTIAPIYLRIRKDI